MNTLPRSYGFCIRHENSQLLKEFTSPLMYIGGGGESLLIRDRMGLFLIDHMLEGREKFLR